MRTDVLNYINKNYGYELQSTYYTNIQEWIQWWRGYVKSFHQYTFNNGITIKTQNRYSLKMAKKVSENWADMLLNEKTKIEISDDATNIFIQGEKGNGGIFRDNDFWKQANSLIEKTFAFGTGAISIRVEDLSLNDDGSVSGNNDTNIKLNYITADKIIPLSWENETITEVAFVSEVSIKGNPFTYLEIHRKEENGKYTIDNRYFNTKNGFKEVTLPDGIAPSFYTDSEIPMFAIFKPNIVNPIEGCGSFGYSIYGNAIDNIKGVDLAYHNLCTDFRLGQKKVFMNKSLLMEDDDGKVIPPDDINENLFSHIGDGMESGQLVQEFNPSLRVDENVRGIQAQLDYLSFKCGLGTKHYQFNLGQGIVTATQYIGDRQDLIQNINKHYIAIKSGLEDLIRAIAYVGSIFVDSTINPDAEIAISFDDSYVSDKDSQLLAMQQDVALGLIRPEIYLAKKYDITEEKAKEMMPSASSTVFDTPFNTDGNGEE